jgi:hypothetical protein
MASQADLLQEQKLVDDAAAFVEHYIETCVHEKAPDDFKGMVATVLMDGFEAGAAWADASAGRTEKSIIVTSSSPL